LQLSSSFYAIVFDISSYAKLLYMVKAMTKAF